MPSEDNIEAGFGEEIGGFARRWAPAAAEDRHVGAVGGEGRDAAAGAGVHVRRGRRARIAAARPGRGIRGGDARIGGVDGERAKVGSAWRRGAIRADLRGDVSVGRMAGVYEGG